MKHIVAIDFGSSKVITAAGLKTSGGIKIVALEYEPVTIGIKNGEITNDTKVEQQALIPTIRRVEEKIGEKITEAYVNISGKFIFCKDDSYSAIRPRSENDITADELNNYTANQFKRSIDNPATSVFEAIAQNYDIDDNIGYSYDEVIGMTGKNIDIKYKLIYGNVSIIDHRRKVLEDCGITMKKAILSPIASARAVLSTQELENGVALVDIGKGCTQIAIIKDNIVRDIYSIPFAGESITNDIKQVTNLSSAWAERVKIEYGCCVEEATPENKKLILHGETGIKEDEVDLLLLTKIIEARISEILEAVGYVIDKSGYSKKIPGGVVITGGSCYLEYLRDLAKVILEKKVRIAAPTNITTDSCEASFDAFAATAVGLIMEADNRLLSSSDMIQSAPETKVEEIINDDKEEAESQDEQDDNDLNDGEKKDTSDQKKGFWDGLFKRSKDKHTKVIEEEEEEKHYDQKSENPKVEPETIKNEEPEEKPKSEPAKSEPVKTKPKNPSKKKAEKDTWNLFSEIFTDNNNA